MHIDTTIDEYSDYSNIRCMRIRALMGAVVAMGGGFSFFFYKNCLPPCHPKNGQKCRFSLFLSHKTCFWTTGAPQRCKNVPHNQSPTLERDPTPFGGQKCCCHALGRPQTGQKMSKNGHFQWFLLVWATKKLKWGQCRARMRLFEPQNVDGVPSRWCLWSLGRWFKKNI